MKLNKIERLKLNLRPYEYYKKIDFLNPKNLDEADRFYLKNFGIYNTKLNPDRFMLRLRIPAGRFDLLKLKKILFFAKKFKAKILLTARAQLELHNLDFESAIFIHKNLENIGLTTWQTLTDNIRNIVTDPLDGVSKESIFDVYKIILKMQNIFLKNPEFVGMIPRKFNCAISGNRKNIVSFFGNDCYFALAKKEKKYGFNLYIGGKNIAIAKSADIFVEKDEVVYIFEAIINLYKKYGLRENRTKARLYHLIEEIKIDGFKDLLKEFYKKDLKPEGDIVVDKYKNSEDFFELKDNRFAFRYKSNFAEIDVDSFEKIVEISLKNNYQLRAGVDQNLYIIGLNRRYFPLNSLSKNKNIISCAGSRYCIYSLFDTKKESKRLLLDKIDKLDIKVGYSGCLKGCARHILCDIGFVGIRTNLYGEVERGVRLFLGGEYTKGKKEARLIYWAVPLRKLNDILNIIFDEFENSRFDDFEDFSKNVLNRYKEDFLAFWFLAKLYTDKKVFLNDKEENLIKLFEKERFFQKSLKETVLILEKELFKIN